MFKKKKTIIYTIIGLILLGAIIFILCSHFILNKEIEKFKGFTFKEITKLNFGDVNLDDFVEEVACEEKCVFDNTELEYEITNIKDLGSQEITVIIEYRDKTYEHTYEIDVVDEIAPIITLKEKEISFLKNSDSAIDEKSYILEVSDNYDELTIDDVEIESNINLKKVGDYLISYTLTDAHNNVGTTTLTAHVIEDEDKENNDDKKEANKEVSSDQETSPKQEASKKPNKETSNNPTNDKNTTQSTSFKTAINSVSLSPLKTRHTELDNQVASIISSVTNSGMSNYEKLQAIYNYVKNKLSYEMMVLIYNELWDMQEEYSYYDFDAMEVMRAIYSLETGKGVCDNYAALFMILARRIGFDAYVVGGSVNKVGGGTTGHAWAMIKAGGTYYIFDPQIEDSKGTSYTYFGKTDKELPIYHYNLSSNISNFKYFKENPNQPHEFEAYFKTSGAIVEEDTLSSQGTYISYSSNKYELGETVNITFSTSRTQNYKLEILKNNEVISSESYDGSSKTITLTFDEVGSISYDVKIEVGDYDIEYGIHGTVEETR